MNSSYYKYCMVPQCKSTTIKTPKKLFIYVPNNRETRDKWLTLARKQYTKFSIQSRMYFCEDHFDLPKDMENYMEYHVMGSVGQVRMRPMCMPTRFECQSDGRIPNILKKKRNLSAKKSKNSDGSIQNILKKKRKLSTKKCKNSFKEISAIQVLEARETSPECSVLEIIKEEVDDEQEAHNTVDPLLEVHMTESTSEEIHMEIKVERQMSSPCQDGEEAVQPKVYISSLARAVMMACEVFGVLMEMVDLSKMASQNHEPENLTDSVHLNPVLDDGSIIIQESHAILMYLADAYGKDDSLYPKDLKRRADINQKLFFDNAILYPRLRSVTYPVFAEGAEGPTERQLRDIEESYVMTEEYLYTTKFIAGDELTIADISIVANITSLTHVLLLDVRKYPRIVAWLQEMEKYLFYKNYNANGAALLGKLYREQLKINNDK